MRAQTQIQCTLGTARAVNRIAGNTGVQGEAAKIQQNLARLSEVSDWQIVEDAGHFIRHDRPEALVNAVREVLEQVGSAPS